MCMPSIFYLISKEVDCGHGFPSAVASSCANPRYLGKYVFDEIIKNKNRFNQAQLKDAQDYMNSIIKKYQKAGIDVNKI
jgi:hypothetical protein